MKGEETGLEIYGIPNAETREAMKEAARNHRANFSRAEELFASLEKDSYPKAYFLSTINRQEESETGKICLYSTAEEAMLHRKHGHSMFARQGLNSVLSFHRHGFINRRTALVRLITRRVKWATLSG